MKIPVHLSVAQWAAIQLRYEARDEHIAAIAQSAGISLGLLTNYAKTHGWLMRSQKRPVSAVPSLAKPITSTTEAINRLKLLVQQRISKLEQNLSSREGEKDSGINAANLLARTLEKVLELEEQQLKHKRLNAAQSKQRDDAWREELAGRLARLGRRSGFGGGVDQGGGQVPAAGLATMGA